MRSLRRYTRTHTYIYSPRPPLPRRKRRWRKRRRVTTLKRPGKAQAPLPAPQKEQSPGPPPSPPLAEAGDPHVCRPPPVPPTPRPSSRAGGGSGRFPPNRTAALALPQHRLVTGARSRPSIPVIPGSGVSRVPCPVPPPRLNSFPRLYFDFPSKAGKQQALSGHERRAQQPGLIPSFKKPVGDAAGRSSRRLITTATTAIGARTGRRRVRRYFPHAPRCPRPKVAQSTGRSGLPCPGQARGAGSEPPEGAGCGVPPARAGGLR